MVQIASAKKALEGVVGAKAKDFLLLALSGTVSYIVHRTSANFFDALIEAMRDAPENPTLPRA